MHEYTKKTIDGIEYGIYQEEGIYLQFPFVDDADAQMKINAYLETAHLEELKEKYPDTWEEELAKENGLSEVFIQQLLNAIHQESIDKQNSIMNNNDEV